MPIAPTYPGVYIEEVPSGVRTITGVATSITAFLGYFSRGPLGQAKRIFNAADFEREYGGLRLNSEASYAIDQFYLNGGGEAWVVRGAKDGTTETASVHLLNTLGAGSLKITAASPGAWGNNLRVDIDHGTGDPANSFNLTVSEVVEDQIVATESFRNLSMVAGDPMDVEKVIEGGSRLIRAERLGATLPAANGTVSATIGPAELPAINPADVMTADITGQHPVASLGTAPTSMAGLAARLQANIRAADLSLQSATVSVTGSLGDGSFLHVRAGTDAPEDTIALGGALAGAAPGLNFGTPNVQQYVLGGGTTAAQQGAGPANAALLGADGDPPEAQDLTDALDALDKIDLFNILSIADTTRLSPTNAAAVAAAATAYCNKRRAFYILDVPQDPANPLDTVEEMQGWIDAHSTLRDKNVATYFPRPRISNPLEKGRLRSIAPSGMLAGLYARTDSNRGVWKAPAGIDAKLKGAQALEYTLTDDENGVLNPLGVNCLRTFRVAGNVCWGARTLQGADALASEWKYVSVRRLALFIEESLYRGSKWVVFEPNDEPLWAQIRLSVGSFMNRLFRQGAFQGSSPREAYLVKCDKETTTQDDINRGIVNIVVGFAPLLPAEFVIIRIQQLAGQVQT